MSNPRFPLQLTVEERKALRIAAASADTTMTDFVRAAIKEKILREQAQDADTNASAVLAKASEKPASYNVSIRPKDGGEDENPPGGLDRVG